MSEKLRTFAKGSRTALALASPEDDVLDAQRAKCRSLLVDFLSADLVMASTLLHTAAAAYDSDIERQRQLIEQAQKLLIAVRGLLGWVEDRATSSAIRQRADELESVLAKFLN
jgi:hypothetical protein